MPLGPDAPASSFSTSNRSLLRRGAITLAALLAYCIGLWIAVPGVSRTLLDQPTFDWLGPTIGRISILSLGLVPFLSALVLIEIILMAYPPLRRWAASSPSNDASLQSWAVFLALAIAGYQANGVAVALESIDTLVASPGLAFRAGVIASLMAGTAFLIWLSSVITRHGLGSGFLLLLAAPLLIVVPGLLRSQGFGWNDVTNFDIPLTLAALFAAAAMLALADRLSPKLAETGQLLWPVLIAYTLAPWFFLALLLVFPPEIFLRAIESLSPGQPARLVILPALTLAFYLLRARSLRQAGMLPAQAGSSLPSLLVVLAVVVPELLIFSLPAPLAFDGRNVAILVVLALAIIESVGMRHSPSRARDS